MGLFDKFKKKSEPLKTHNLGGCIITKSLYDGSSKLKWMFREKGINLVDNGWLLRNIKYKEMEIHNTKSTIWTLPCLQIWLKR